MSFRQAVNRWQSAVKAGATDLYLVPMFGESVVLEYENGKLQNSPLERGTAGFRRLLYTPTARLAGIAEYRYVQIRGYYEDGWFCASEIRVQSDSLQPPLSRAVQLHLLAARGFSTVIPLCSWAAVNGVQNSGATTCELPTALPAVQKRLRARLTALREVLANRRPSYWQSATLYRKSRNTEYGRRCLPFSDVLGIEVAEATGIQFAETDCDFPRLW